MARDKTTTGGGGARSWRGNEVKGGFKRSLTRNGERGWHDWELKGGTGGATCFRAGDKTQNNDTFERTFHDLKQLVEKRIHCSGREGESIEVSFCQEFFHCLGKGTN